MIQQGYGPFLEERVAVIPVNTRSTRATLDPKVPALGPLQKYSCLQECPAPPRSGKTVLQIEDQRLALV